MIREVKMYEAVCDRCGKSSRTKYKTRDFVDICVEVDENWVKIDNLNYCPDCYEYDEETDEYKPKKKED